MLTDREQARCREIAHWAEQTLGLLSERSLGDPEDTVHWYEFLSRLRLIQGNLSNDVSFIATLLAKRYLAQRFHVDFDAAEKPQGAPGIDIDVLTADGQRIVAEIKTTLPYQVTDFGAQQAASFKKDFAKLTSASAQHKFLFVTEEAAYTALKKQKYIKLMPGVKIVQLLTGEEQAG